VIEALRARGLWPERPRQDWTPQQRAECARERRDIERDLPAAIRWRRAAVLLTEESLVLLKAALFEAGPAEPEEISRTEAHLARIRRMEDGELVGTYRCWRTQWPALADAMVRAIEFAEQTERTALEAYWQAMEASN
jgi:hypothetical protein